MTSALWPEGLLVIRHAESVGNLARDRAEASGEALIDIAVRDMDVDLSPTGEEQAARLGEWLATGPPPAAIYASPYVRAARTAEIARDVAGFELALTLDERLREREFGILDRLTRTGIEARFPQEAEARAKVGKFYYRPPGGESWCDVALRVRSAIDSISREFPGEHVVVVADEVVVYMFRYVLERLTESAVLALGVGRDLANCSVTEFRLGESTGVPRLELRQFAVLPERVPVTVEEDVAVLPDDGSIESDDVRAIDRSLLRAVGGPTGGAAGSKFERGQIVVIGGDPEAPGGAVLAALAALRAGAGRAHVVTDAAVAPVVPAVATPELRVTGYPGPPAAPDLGASSLGDAIRAADAVLVGSGSSDADRAGHLLAQVVALMDARAGLVVDAAALRSLRTHEGVLDRRAGRTMLVPNLGEAAELLDIPVESVEAAPVPALQKLVDRFDATIALRGSTTWIADHANGPFVEVGGHEALGTSGSGDVLAGIVAGLVARGAEPLAALVWAVHTHAACGRVLADRDGGLGLLARELLDVVAPTLNALLEEQ